MKKLHTLDENMISLDFNSKSDFPKEPNGLIEVLAKEKPESDLDKLIRQQMEEENPSSIQLEAKKLKMKLIGPEEIEIKKTPFVLGKKGDYEIKDEYISRRHCEINLKNNHYEIRDLDSMNGTFVNNEKIATTILKDRDIVKLAEREYEVNIWEN